MEYPLIDTGMGDAPTAVPAPRTSMNPAEQFDPEAFKLLEGVSPLTIGVVDSIADYSNRALQANDLITAAKQGKTATQRAAELAESRRQMELERSRIQMREADPTAMNQAFDNVAGIMGNAPVMPQMQRPELSDTERLGSILAGAIGGGWEGAGMAQNAAFQGAGVRADRENRIAQQNFEAENGQWMNKLRVAQQQANNQSNIFNQAENRNQRQYTNEIRLQDGRIAKTQQDIEDVDKEIGSYVTDTQKMISEYTKLKGEMTDKDIEYLMGEIAKREKAHGLPPGYIAERMMTAPVGWKSAVVRNQERDDTFRGTKYDDDKKRFEESAKLKATKQNFDISMNSWKQYLANLNRVGIVDENDVAELTEIRAELAAKYGFSEKMFPLPKVGTTWQRIMAEASGKRQEAAANRQIGGELVDQYWKKREAALKAFDAATEPLEKVYTDAGKQRDSLKESMDKAADAYRKSNAESDNALFLQAKAAYDRFLPNYESAKKKYESRTQERGRMVENWDAQMPSDNLFGKFEPFDPNSGKKPDAPNGFRIDEIPPPIKTTKPTNTLPDPRGGNPPRKDKSPTQNPPATPKPVESKPDAKKEQKGKTVPKAFNVGKSKYTQTK